MQIQFFGCNTLLRCLGFDMSVAWLMSHSLSLGVVRNYTFFLPFCTFLNRCYAPLESLYYYCKKYINVLKPKKFRELMFTKRN